MGQMMGQFMPVNQPFACVLLSFLQWGKHALVSGMPCPIVWTTSSKSTPIHDHIGLLPIDITI